MKNKTLDSKGKRKENAINTPPTKNNFRFLGLQKGITSEN